MTVAEAFTTLGEIVTVLTPVAGVEWGIFKLGRVSGKKQAERSAAQAKDRAKVDNLARELAETRQQLAEAQKQLTALQRSQLGSGHP